jgi:hypothetical protein
MYGREARRPIHLQFRTSFVDTMSPDVYVKQLQSSLCSAYRTVRSNLGDVQ